MPTLIRCILVIFLVFRCGFSSDAAAAGGTGGRGSTGGTRATGGSGGRGGTGATGGLRGRAYIDAPQLSLNLSIVHFLIVSGVILWLLKPPSLARP
jgi:hypothetical protein